MADQNDVRRIALALPDTVEESGRFGFAVRLPAIDVDELAEVITDAWRCEAPEALVQTFDDDGR